MKKIYKIIQTKQDVEEIKKYISKNSLFAYDTETTGLNVRKDAVVGYSISATIGTGYYFPLKQWDGTELVQQPHHSVGLKLLNELAKKQLVMHNASYDIRVTKNNLKVDLMPALVADTVLMKHTVDEERPFGLKEISIRLQKMLKLDESIDVNIEQQEMKESVKRNGGKVTSANMEIYKAELEYLGKYAASDADLTLRLFEYYYKKLEDEDLVEFFFDDEVMPLYKEVTIPMEENGIKVDIPKIKKYDYEIVNDMVALEEEIQMEFKDVAEEAVTTLIQKKCPISHKGSYAQKLAKRFNLKVPMTKSGKFSITAKTLAAAKTDDNVEVIEFLLGSGSFSIGLGYTLYEIQKEIYLEKMEQKYLININSKQQLCEIFYNCLGEKPSKKTPSGNPSMDVRELERLAEKHKAASLLVLYNKLNKIKSAYIDRLIREHENGYFYPTFKQFGTISGRFAGDLQQLPKPVDKEDEDKFHPLELKYRNVVREFFVSKPGHLFIDSDFESLEPHVFADDSEDMALLDVFRKGFDLYSTIAIQADPLLEGKRDLYSADKKADNYLKKHEPGIRQRGKAYTLGIRYGMQSFKLAHTLGIEQEEAELIIQNYFSAFPGLKKAMDKYVWSAKKQGKVKSYYGRVRHMPECRQIYNKFGEAIADPLKSRMLAKRYSLDLELIKTLRKKYNNYINNALNFPIQSAGASIVNRASIAISREFKEKKIQGVLIANIHDQIIVEVKEEYATVAKEIVQRCMENATKLKHLKLKAPPEIGTNFKDTH